MESDCSICLDALGNCYFATDCNHHFHIKCISIWYKKTQTCPICRSSMIKVFETITKSSQIISIIGRKWKGIKGFRGSEIEEDLLPCSIFDMLGRTYIRFDESVCLGMYTGMGPTCCRHLYLLTNEGICAIDVILVHEKAENGIPLSEFEIIDKGDCGFTKIIYKTNKILLYGRQ